jgi:hypothetical protein
MGDKVAYETNNRRLAELDRPQDQWVQSNFEEEGYESEVGPTTGGELEEFESYSEGDAKQGPGGLDRQEKIYPPLEVVTPLARKATADTEALGRQERGLSFSEEKDETCIASYYPMVGIFKTEEI